MKRIADESEDRSNSNESSRDDDYAPQTESTPVSSRPQIKATSRPSIHELAALYPNPSRPLINASHSRETHPSRLTADAQFKKLGDAIVQAASLTLDDLGSAGRQRPRFEASYNMQGAKKEITISIKSRRTVMFIPRTDTDYSFQVEFHTNTKCGTFTNSQGILSDSYVYIAYNESESVADTINDTVIQGITEIISNVLLKHPKYKPLLHAGNIEKTQTLPSIFRGHLEHALAAAFGGHLKAGNQPIVLTPFDTIGADEQFRKEFKALQSARRGDNYLLTTFGMVAAAKAGEDACIIAQWQTGRTLDLPDSLEKIRLINAAMQDFGQKPPHKQAEASSNMLAQIRSLQSTINRDIIALSEDAKSIHAAKTLMTAHKQTLQRYEHGFQRIKETVTGQFGNASFARKEEYLKTSLLAAQIHSGNQGFIHEHLTHRMMEQISDLSTRLSFLTLSVNQLVTIATIRALLEDEDSTLADIARDALADTGLSKAEMQKLRNMKPHDLDRIIQEKMSALENEIRPFVQEVNDIEEQIALNDLRDPVLMITDQRRNDEPFA